MYLAVEGVEVTECMCIVLWKEWRSLGACVSAVEKNGGRWVERMDRNHKLEWTLHNK